MTWKSQKTALMTIINIALVASIAETVITAVTTSNIIFIMFDLAMIGMFLYLKRHCQSIT